jgi:hypothetical protein
MANVLAVFSFIVAHYQEISGYLVVALGAIIAICMLIPGPQPEGFLQKVVDFISKFSRKPPSA